MDEKAVLNTSCGSSSFRTKLKNPVSIPWVRTTAIKAAIEYITAITPKSETSFKDNKYRGVRAKLITLPTIEGIP